MGIQARLKQAPYIWEEVVDTTTAAVEAVVEVARSMDKKDAELFVVGVVALLLKAAIDAKRNPWIRDLEDPTTVLRHSPHGQTANLLYGRKGRWLMNAVVISATSQFVRKMREVV